MGVRRVFASPAPEATVRAGTFLVVGGVLLGAYGVLTVGFLQLYADPTIPNAAVTALAVVTVVIALAPLVLPQVRALEIAAARSLLDAEVPPSRDRPSAASRARGALWYLTHLAAGGAATLALLTAVPVAVVLLVWQVDRAPVLRTAVGSLTDLPVLPAVLVALLLLAAPGVAVVVLRAVLRRLAPVLLGPSAAERIAELEAQQRALAARNHLARELHDTVGHALTVTTLQAAAAAHAFDRDPAFARSALVAIEETARAAVADLDQVLGLLREDGREEDRGIDATRQGRTVSDLPALVEEARRAGTAAVSLELPAPEVLASLPPATAREAFAVVREALTNALRHGGGTIAVALVRTDDGLQIDLENDLPPGAPMAATPARRGRARTSGGRGLPGLRERVGLLGGTVTWGSTAAGWRVRAWLPDEAVGR